MQKTVAILPMMSAINPMSTGATANDEKRIFFHYSFLPKFIIFGYTKPSVYTYHLKIKYQLGQTPLYLNLIALVISVSALFLK